MSLEHLPISKLQAQVATALDALPASGNWPNLVRNYMIACKVEGKSPRTLETALMVIGRLMQFIQSQAMPDDVGALNSSHVRLFLLGLQDSNLSPSTVSIYYRTLHTFFNWLIAEGMLETSPMRNIKPPRVPQVVVKPFSEDDIRNLLLLCSSDKFLDVRNRAIILLFLDTGLRLEELAGIKLEDINLDRETIRVMGKGAKERFVRIGKTVQRALLRYLLMRQDEHDCLWVSEERRPMTKYGISTLIQRLCRRADIRGCKHGPHTFRHTAAITYLRNSGSEFTLQIMLGHSTLAMTRKYASSLGTEDMIRVHRGASPVDNMKLK